MSFELVIASVDVVASVVVDVSEDTVVATVSVLTVSVEMVAAEEEDET